MRKSNMIGRIAEQKSLMKAYSFHESQFVAVYGRRRVGKTYLVRKTFDNNFAFYHTGVTIKIIANSLRRSEIRWRSMV